MDSQPTSQNILSSNDELADDLFDDWTIVNFGPFPRDLIPLCVYPDTDEENA